MIVGDKVTFLCNGKGRGGHYRVSGIVTKVNAKTVDLTEAPGSYKPGTLWRVYKAEVQPYEMIYGSTK